MRTESFHIEQRYCGPPRSGNGGYVCGRVAASLPGTVAVRLKAPPPLETELRLQSSQGVAQLFSGEVLVAEARPATLDLDVPAPPTLEQARQASGAFLGFRFHPFPGCFVCGPNRHGSDGLRIFPGPVGGTALLAAAWTPDESLADASGRVRREFLWAALDCPGCFAVFAGAEQKAFVLGELCASVAGPVASREPCIVAAWPIAQEGRKRFAGTALFGQDGMLVAKARATWIEVPLSAWG